MIGGNGQGESHSVALARKRFRLRPGPVGPRPWGPAALEEPRDEEKEAPSASAIEDAESLALRALDPEARRAKA